MTHSSDESRQNTLGALKNYQEVARRTREFMLAPVPVEAELERALDFIIDHSEGKLPHMGDLDLFRKFRCERFELCQFAFEGEQ